jgi:hypothetical protein
MAGAQACGGFGQDPVGGQGVGMVGAENPLAIGKGLLEQKDCPLNVADVA